MAQTVHTAHTAQQVEMMVACVRLAVIIACACALATGQFCRLYATLLYFIWRDAIPPRHPWATQWMLCILLLCACHCAGAP